MVARKRSVLLAAAVLLAGCALRVRWNDVARYSPADETHYLSVARWLLPDFIGNYPKVTRWFIATEGAHDSPSLNRAGHFALAAAACRLAPACDYRALAWLSTLAGIAALVLTWLLGRELLGERAALLAAAFSVTSPLQLALGRRALQDEVVCAAFLAAIWTFVRALREPAPGRVPWRHLLAAAAATFALAEKETLVLLVPGFVLLWLRSFPRRGWQRRDLLFLVPPFAFLLALVSLQRSASDFLAIARIGAESIRHSDYALQYQGGPLHLVLVDLLLLSPVVFLLAAGAAGTMAGPAEGAEGARLLAAFTFVTLAVFFFVSKNPRYFVAADPLLRLLAAWFVVARAPRGRVAAAACAALACSAGAELWLFHRVFIERGVYDPTTVDLLRALDAIPRL